jgi:hypothetical protein
METGTREIYLIQINLNSIYLRFFKDFGSCSHNLASNISVISCFETIRKEAILTQFEALTRHLADWSKENNEKAQKVKAVSGPRLEPGPPKYKTGVLTTRLQCSFIQITN